MEIKIALKMVPIKIPLPTDRAFSSLIYINIIDRDKENTATNNNFMYREFEESKNRT